MNLKCLNISILTVFLLLSPFIIKAQNADSNFVIDGNLLNDGLIRLYSVKFLKDDVIIKKESFPVLDSVAKLLLKNPSVRVEVSSFSEATDSSSAKYDKMVLDKEMQKAKAVCNYMIFKGVSEPRLICKGYKSSASQSIINEETEANQSDSSSNTQTDSLLQNNDSIPVQKEIINNNKQTVISPRIEFRVISK